MPNLEDYGRLVDSGVIEETRAELLRELYDQWRFTETVEDREKIFFRAMAIDDIAEAIIARAKQRLEVV